MKLMVQIQEEAADILVLKSKTQFAVRTFIAGLYLTTFGTYIQLQQSIHWLSAR
jgi:hypothetical protein